MPTIIYDDLCDEILSYIIDEWAENNDINEVEDYDFDDKLHEHIDELISTVYSTKEIKEIINNSPYDAYDIQMDIYDTYGESLTFNEDLSREKFWMRLGYHLLKNMSEIEDKIQDDVEQLVKKNNLCEEPLSIINNARAQMLALEEDLCIDDITTSLMMIRPSRWSRAFMGVQDHVNEEDVNTDTEDA